MDLAQCYYLTQIHEICLQEYIWVNKNVRDFQINLPIPSKESRYTITTWASTFTDICYLLIKTFCAVQVLALFYSIIILYQHGYRGFCCILLMARLAAYIKIICLKLKRASSPLLTFPKNYPIHYNVLNPVICCARFCKWMFTFQDAFPPLCILHIAGHILSASFPIHVATISKLRALREY